MPIPFVAGNLVTFGGFLAISYLSWQVPGDIYLSWQEPGDIYLSWRVPGDIVDLVLLLFGQQLLHLLGGEVSEEVLLDFDLLAVPFLVVLPQEAAVAQLVGPVGLKAVGAGLTFTYGNQWFKKISFKIVYSLNNPNLNA